MVSSARARQPAELGWGSHEKNWPRDGKKHDFGRGSAIYLMQPGAATRVRTWTPLAGPFHGFLITHGESISISDYLTIRKGEKVEYRPTVHYAYHPCDAAVLSVHELAGRNWQIQERKRVMMEEIVRGVDELGVLLAGHKRNAYWYGSQLSVEEARQLAPHNSATSLQVTVSVLAGLVWAIENPNSGVVEPEEMDYRRVLEICPPYLGPVVGEYGSGIRSWIAAACSPRISTRRDPWQFKNVRVDLRRTCGGSRFPAPRLRWLCSPTPGRGVSPAARHDRGSLRAEDSAPHFVGARRGSGGIAESSRRSFAEWPRRPPARRGRLVAAGIHRVHASARDPIVASATRGHRRIGEPAFGPGASWPRRRLSRRR